MRVWSTPRTEVVVATPDAALAGAVIEILTARPLQATAVDDVGELGTLGEARWRGVLLVIIDVDAGGAWDFIGSEDRLGGLLFSVPFLVASAHAILHPSDEDERAPPAPWSGVLARPPDPGVLLRAVDREVLFEHHAQLLRGGFEVSFGSA
jgi:hypothetical protein